MKALVNEKIKKDGKNVFAYILEYCASFGNKNSFWPLLKGGGGVCMSLTRTWPHIYIYIDIHPLRNIYIYTLNICICLVIFVNSLWEAHENYF